MRSRPIKLLASRREAAVVLRVGVRTVDALAEQGRLRPIFIGSRKLFLWADIRKLGATLVARKSSTKGVLAVQ